MQDHTKHYYKDFYGRVQRQGLQGWGNSLIDKWVEKAGPVSAGPLKILEIGASSGEHVHFAKARLANATYVGLDLQPGLSNPDLFNFLAQKGFVQFVTGDAEKLPFDSQVFDRSISMCVLAHVNNPERVFLELKRVTKRGGTW